MFKLKKNESGFSPVEIVAVILVVALVGAAGYVVYKHQYKKPVVSYSSTNIPSSTASKTVSSSPQSTLTTQSGASNTALQSQLTGVDSLNNQSSQDLNSSNNSVNDQSTFTSY
jgi:hypothetical protein